MMEEDRDTATCKALEQLSRDGLHHVSHLLELLADEDGEERSRSADTTSAVAPEPITAAEDVVIQHLMKLCGAVLSYTCAWKATDRDAVFGSDRDAVLQRHYTSGAAALLCGWLLDHVTLSPAAEAEVIRRLPEHSWWWKPALLRSEESSSRWVSRALSCAALSCQERTPPPPPGLGVRQRHNWLWGVCRQAANHSGTSDKIPHCDMLYCFLDKVFHMTEAPAETTRRSRPVFSHRLHCGAAVLQQLLEAKGTLCYHSAVRYSLSAVREILHGYEQIWKEKNPAKEKVDVTEAERQIVRTALLRSSAVVFECLLSATDAMRAAAAQWGSEGAEEFLSRYIRPALLGCGPPSLAAGPAVLYTHPCVEVSSNSWRISSLNQLPNDAAHLAVGVVATNALQEGELLSLEQPTAFWSRTDIAADKGSAKDEAPLVNDVDGGLTPDALLMSRVLDLIRDAEMTLRAQLVEGRLFHDGVEDMGPFLLGCSLQQADDTAENEREVTEKANWNFNVAHYLRLLSQLRTPDHDSSPCSEVELAKRWVEALQREPHRSKGIRGIDLFKIGLVSYEALESRLPSGPNWWSSASPEEAGRAAYYFTRFYQHSCSPNVLLVFPTDEALPGTAPTSAADPRVRREWLRSPTYTGAVAAVALRDIEPGEELTVSFMASPLQSADAKAKLLQFRCRCSFCATKTPLLEGSVCLECRQLLYQPPDDVARHRDPARNRTAPLRAALMTSRKGYQHDDSCALRTSSREWHQQRAAATLSRFENELEKIYERFDADLVRYTEDAAGKEKERESTVDEALSESDEGCGHSGQQDPHRQLIRRLGQLDTAADGVFLPTHFLRLRIRQELLALGTVSAHLTPEDSSHLLSVAAELVRDVELLLPENHSLCTGLRMQYAFLRGRHISSTGGGDPNWVSAAKLDGCCGAVREEAAVLQRPFLRDPLLRGCVIRCFQEHFTQLVGWDMPRVRERALSEKKAEETVILSTFLQRFPVELLAVGIDTPDYFAMLSMMEVGDNVTAGAGEATPFPYPDGEQSTTRMQDGRLPGDLYPPWYEPDPFCP